MKFQPLGDRIRIKPDSVKTVTDSGLDIPQEAQGKSITGVVVSVGPLVKNVSVGSRVVFSEFAGTRINVDGEEVLYLKEGDCHFVISE